MSNLDDLAAELNTKWKSDNGRVPDIHEVLAATYDPIAKALRISGGGGNSLFSQAQGYIAHGSNAGAVRPVGFASVTWVGSVEPTNAIDGDIWIEA